MTIFDDVEEFHKALDVPIGPRPGFPSDDEVHLRNELLAEEIRELSYAIANKDIVEAADAIADAVYVLLGTALSFGIPFDEVWKEVHRSNMDKAGGPVRADGKRLKPEGWKPPDVKGVLAQHNSNGD